MNSQIFAWGNYEDNPLNEIGLDSLHEQKGATYNDAADGVFTGNAAESFFSNEDKTLVSNPAMVIGENPMDLVFGKGTVPVGIEVHYIKTAEEYAAAMDGWLGDAGYGGAQGGWQDGMEWAVGIIGENKTGVVTVTVNGTPNGVVIKDGGVTPTTNAFERDSAHRYIIVDKGEVFVNDEAVTNVNSISFLFVEA